MKDLKLFRTFIKYVVLNILGQMAYACYTLTDTFFVSADQGSMGLTALNLAFPVFCLMNGLGLMIGIGGGTRYSIMKSRGDQNTANRIFSTALHMVIGCAVFFVLLGIFFSEHLVVILGADSTMFTMTNTYLKVMLLFAPAFLLNTLLQCFIRNDGAPSLSMSAMVIGSFSNVILDYIFIFPLGMGIFGAILATGLAPLISMVVMSGYFIKRKNSFSYIGRKRKSQGAAEIIVTGIPSLIAEAASGIVMFVFNLIILRLEGNIGVAAFGIVSVISLAVAAIYTGLAQGIQPVLSLNQGLGNMSNIKKILKYSMVTSLILSCMVYIVVFFRASQMAYVFNSERDEILQTLAVNGMKLYFLACPFIGFNIVTATYFTSTERPRPAQVISLLRGLFLLVPMAFLLSAIWKLTGVWCAYPLTEGVVTLIGIWLLIRARTIKKNKKLFPAQ